MVPLCRARVRRTLAVHLNERLAGWLTLHSAKYCNIRIQTFIEGSGIYLLEHCKPYERLGRRYSSSARPWIRGCAPREPRKADRATERSLYVYRTWLCVAEVSEEAVEWVALAVQLASGQSPCSTPARRKIDTKVSSLFLGHSFRSICTRIVNTHLLHLGDRSYFETVLYTGYRCYLCVCSGPSQRPLLSQIERKRLQLLCRLASWRTGLRLRRLIHDTAFAPTERSPAVKK